MPAYDKDEVELQEVSEDEIFDFVGVEVFDNFGLCSTKKTDTLCGCLFSLCGHGGSASSVSTMRSIGEGNEGSGSPVGYPAKQEAT